jgi:GGDEF domain-containing protein
MLAGFIHSGYPSATPAALDRLRLRTNGRRQGADPRTTFSRMEPCDPRMEGDAETAAQRLARGVRAAQELCDVLWGAARAELELAGGADAVRVGELAGRLADICATVATLAAAAPVATPLRPPEPALAEGIAIHDARAHESAHEPAQAHEPTRSAWIAAIARRLERYREDRLPFAVLLIEAAELDRLVHAESAQELERLTAALERALGEELRPADLLMREARGRYWLITPETDPFGAGLLAQRLAGAVRTAALHRGVGLQLALGIAVCPDDGLDADALAAHADVGVYAARAAGWPLAFEDGPPAGL